MSYWYNRCFNDSLCYSSCNYNYTSAWPYYIVNIHIKICWPLSCKINASGKKYYIIVSSEVNWFIMCYWKGDWCHVIQKGTGITSWNKGLTSCHDKIDWCSRKSLNWYCIHRKEDWNRRIGKVTMSSLTEWTSWQCTCGVDCSWLALRLLYSIYKWIPHAFTILPYSPLCSFRLGKCWQKANVTNTVWRDCQRLNVIYNQRRA